MLIYTPLAQHIPGGTRALRNALNSTAVRKAAQDAGVDLDDSEHLNIVLGELAKVLPHVQAQTQASTIVELSARAGSQELVAEASSSESEDEAVERLLPLVTQSIQHYPTKRAIRAYQEMAALAAED